MIWGCDVILMSDVAEHKKAGTTGPASAAEPARTES